MTLNEKAHNLVSQMTIEEKISLFSGLDCWHTKPVSRLNIPSVMVSDGPHGLRKQAAAQDNFGVGESIKATCFPTASLTACSFDEDLLYEMGKAIAEECISENVDVILGPGINMKRNPLCGRNFEYFSEDPLVAGKMAAAFIKGVQSLGVGTSLKHFAVNNQEKRRMSISAVVDRRTLFEYYLKAFEIAVKEANPWTVMCSYNKINGTYSSENKELLTDILRCKWGFKGLTVSDWGAVHIRSEGVKAGLDLEMPGNKGLNDKKVLKDFKKGLIDSSEIDKCAVRVTELALKAEEEKSKRSSYNNFSDKKELLQKHHDLAIKIAENSMVLLKNEDNILPFKKDTSPMNILFIGEMAAIPRYQGAGSSRINPANLLNPIDAFTQEGCYITYAKGYNLDGKPDDSLIEEAVRMASTTQNVVIFAGLPPSDETEGLDRIHLNINDNQVQLIKKVAQVNSKAVVVLMGGSPFNLDWKDNVKTILLSYLGGEGVGTALYHIISGQVSPSGKLTESWPVKLEDCLSTQNFPGDCKNVLYKESIFTGYRYFHTVQKQTNYLFGHGLSYTTFAYSNFTAEECAEQKIMKGESFTVNFTLENTGLSEGKETAFIFASTPYSQVFHSKESLAAFKKIKLNPGEKTEVSITINPRELSYYNSNTDEWELHKGPIILSLGGSLDSISSKITLFSSSETATSEVTNAYTTLSSGKDVSCITDEDFESIYGKKLPPAISKIEKPFTKENCLLDAENTWLGKLVKKVTLHLMKKVSDSEKDQLQMMIAAAMEMPFYGLPAASNGLMKEWMVKLLIKLLNI